MSDLRWLDHGGARFEEHTAENATPECKPDCVGHYVWPLQLERPAFNRVLRTLEDAK